MNFITKNRVFYFLGILFIFIIWIILSMENPIIPTLKECFLDLINLIKDYKNIHLILFTILKVILVLLLSFVISFIIGFLSYKFKFLRNFFAPIISVLRCLPVACVIVIILILFSKRAPIIVTMMVVVPVFSESIYKSLLTMDKTVLDDVKLLSNDNFMVLFKVYIPMIMPYILSMFLSLFGLGLKVLIMSELITQSANTIGYEIQIAKLNIDLTRIFSWSIILVIIDLIIEEFIKLFDKKIMRNL